MFVHVSHCFYQVVTDVGFFNVEVGSPSLVQPSVFPYIQVYQHVCHVTHFENDTKYSNGLIMVDVVQF